MTLWPFGVYALAAVAIAAGLIALSQVLGQYARGAEVGAPYESGIETTGSARVRLAVRFYLIAVLFLIFDLEVAVIVTWALVAQEVGWPGYGEISVFVGVLLIALLYLWRNGALEQRTGCRPSNCAEVRAGQGARRAQSGPL